MEKKLVLCLRKLLTNIKLPKLKIHGDGILFAGGHRSNPGLEIPKKKQFELINYNPLPAIPAKLNVGKS